MKWYYWALTGLVAIAAAVAVKKFVIDKKTDKIVSETDTKDLPEITYFFKIERTGDLDRDIPRFILLKEGAGDDDPDDPAAKYRAKGIYTIGKRTYTNPHTRKGITYQTWVNNAAKLGLNPSADSFWNMSDQAWLKIYRELYLKPFENVTKSKLINYYISLWAWGSGVGGAKALIKTLQSQKGNLQTYLDKHGEKETLKALVLARIAFYKRLADKKPVLKKYVQGWTNSAVSFYKNFA